MAGDIYLDYLATSACLAGGAPLFQQTSPSKLGMAGTAWSEAVLPHLAMRILDFGWAKENP